MLLRKKLAVSSLGLVYVRHKQITVAYPLSIVVV